MKASLKWLLKENAVTNHGTRPANRVAMHLGVVPKKEGIEGGNLIFQTVLFCLFLSFFLISGS